MPVLFVQEIVCVTVGTITKIVMDNHSWCYPACSQCHKKTDIDVANLHKGASFKNILRNRVSFKRNSKGGLFCKWVPPLTMAWSLEPPEAMAGQGVPLLAAAGQGVRRGYRHWCWRDMSTWAVPPLELVG